MSERIQAFNDATKNMHILGEELGKNMIGNERPIELTVGSLVTGQHIMYEGEPGTGKTELAKRVSAATGLSYGRIQGVADTVPADIIGYEMPSMTDNEGRIHMGPIHNSVVFVDEMNRMSTKAQSALNAAMAEGKVTIGNNEYSLNGERPFLVVATQNEHGQGQGTFPVSDALYDRFGMVVPFEEPTADQIAQVITSQKDGHAAEATKIEEVVNEDQIMAISAIIGKVTVNEAEVELIANLNNIVRDRTPDANIRVMGGYRLAKAMTKLTQARALQQDRAKVTSDDILELAPLVMGHRIEAVLSDEYRVPTIKERQQIVRTAVADHLS